MVAQFQIQQCLHGYDDGHELLASSIKLSSPDAYLLSQLSDLSGQNSPREISGYLTGYPLETAPYYVIARTWLAYELPRPGCAWTHSLLIENGDLSAVRQAQGLMDLFRRPELVDGQPDRQSYASPLVVSEETFLAPPEVDGHEDRLDAIVRGLYQAPKKKVFLVSSGNESNTATVLGIWSQQWPRLRRSFRFCSGTLQDRSDGKLKFDFQILVQSRALSSILNDPDALVLDRSRPSDIVDAEWITDVVNDIRNPPFNALRRFLWRYGPDTRGGREAFQHLANIFHLLSKGDVNSVLRAVSIYEVESTQFSTFLKHMVEGYSEGSASGIPPLAPFVLLRVLLRWGENAFSLDSLEELARSAVDGVGRPAVAEVLLDSKDTHTTAWEAGARAVLSDYFSSKHSGGAKLVENLVSRNASLLGLNEVWKAPPATLEAMLTHLSPSALSPAVIRTASCAAFHAGRSKAAYYFLKQNAQAAAFGLMDAAEASNSDFDYKSLCRVLEDYEKQATAWLKQRECATPGQLAVILELVGYDRRVITSFPPHVWAPLARAETLWSPQVVVQSKASLLMTALNSGSWNAGGILAAGSFELIHRLLANDDLPNRLWYDLRHYVPELDWRDNWDKAERLRHAVLDAFAKGWPLESFFEVVTSTGSFEAMVTSKILTQPQTKVVNSILEAIRSGQMPAPPWLAAKI